MPSVTNKSSLIESVRLAVKQVNRENLKKLTMSKRFMRWLKRIIVFIIVVHLIGIVINYLRFKAEFWDNNENRGAVSSQEDIFDEKYAIPDYLEQGWSKRDSLWFYNTSQGSNLIPYDFFMALEQVDNKQLFRSWENMKKYRYLKQSKTFSNPDSLLLGFVKDEYQGKEYIGFTCAACHTSQINYSDITTNEKKAIRIDGGPAQTDMESFMMDLSDTLQETLSNQDKKHRFISAVLERNGIKKLILGGRQYVTEKEVEDDLIVFSRKLMNYNWINRPDTEYGYSRLDAFGRIFNRVAQHVFDKKTLRKSLSEILSESDVEKTMKSVNKMNSGNETHLVDSTLNHFDNINDLVSKQRFTDSIFSTPDAPVSYPYLWDVPYHDYLQWNGIVNNAGGGSLGRNIGQVIGVFGTLDWKKSNSFSVTDLLIDQKSVLDKVRFHSSIHMRNIFRVENQLKKLQSPVWPETKLGVINKTKVAKGKKLFSKYCQECHENIERDDPQRRITAHISSVKNVGTDPKMASNSISKTAYTGIIQGSYVDLPVGKVLLQEKAPIALMVTTTTENTIKTPNVDSNILVRWSDWIYDLFFVFIDNPVENTVKKGDYTPDSTANPFASLLSYKARSLNGIWATAPYLHNGSVPTLYDLLLPQNERPPEFMVGSREFDVKKIGFKSDGYDGFLFDTTQEGNHNTGHEYAAGNTALPNGTTLPPLNKTQRYDLIEYLKTL